MSPIYKEMLAIDGITTTLEGWILDLQPRLPHMQNNVSKFSFASYKVLTLKHYDTILLDTAMKSGFFTDEELAQIASLEEEVKISFYQRKKYNKMSEEEIILYEANMKKHRQRLAAMAGDAAFVYHTAKEDGESEEGALEMIKSLLTPGHYRKYVGILKGARAPKRKRKAGDPPTRWDKRKAEQNPKRVEKYRSGSICPCCGEEYEKGLWDRGRNFCSRGTPFPCYKRCKYKGGASGRPCQNEARPQSGNSFKQYCREHRKTYEEMSKEEKKENFFQAKKDPQFKVTKKVALDVRATGSQDNTENREKNKEVIVYDVEKVVNGKVVTSSKGRATVKSKNSVKDVVTGKNNDIQDACRAARSDLHPKTCRRSQPRRVTPKSEKDTHYNIVARFA